MATVLGIGLMATLGFAALPATASAESLCTDTWTGPAEGSWATAENWSAKHVPGSTDVACIGAGKVVVTPEGTSETGVVQGEGTLAVGKGTLEVKNTLEASSIKGLALRENAKLKNAGTLEAYGSFSAEHGAYIEGEGKTVLGSSVSTTLAKAVYFYLVKQTLVNDGSLTVGKEAALVGSEGAAITNHGTLTVNGETEFYGLLSEGSGSKPTLTNTGTLTKSEGPSGTLIEFQITNEGTVKPASGALIFTGGGTAGEKAGTWSDPSGVDIDLKSGSFALGSTASISGSFNIEGSGTLVSVGKIEGPEANFYVGVSAKLEVNGPGTSTIEGMTLVGFQTGAGELDISSSLNGEESGHLEGTGKTVLKPGASGSIANHAYFVLQHRSLVNEGSLTVPLEATIIGREGATLLNRGTLTVNGQNEGVFHKGLVNEEPEPLPTLTNTGTLRKTEGTGVTSIRFAFENLAKIEEQTGKFEITHPISAKESQTQYGGSESTPGHPCPICGEPVVAATGDLVETQTDLTVSGRGVGLDLIRTYNSQAAAEGTKSIFGYGWSSSFSDHLTVEKEAKKVTLDQASGATVPFAESGSSWVAPSWTQDKLSGSAEAGYTLTLPNQTQYKFQGSSGRLESITDRNSNETKLAYNETTKLLETITDPSGRKLTLKENAEGLVESAKDPAGHEVKYTYEAGNLATVTLPGEEKARWSFKYDGSHQLTELTDGRGGKTLNEYNSEHKVDLQTDPLKRELRFEYEAFKTKITNKATGAVTLEQFTSNDEPFSVTRGYGSELATTESWEYNEAGYITSETDGNKHTTKYGYDSESNRTSAVNPEEHETKWEYNTTHDVISSTSPKGDKTTIKRDSHGNVEAVERPAPEGKTQVIKYKYGSHGEEESYEDPLKHTWKYEYNAHGDRTAEIDPLSDKRTWGYDEDSFVTSMVSPRGHVKAGEESKYTTKIERDAQGRPITVTDPLGHTTKYKYDGDGNTETQTDGNSHTTTFGYDADNEPTSVKEANGNTTEAEYNGEGRVSAEKDGNKHATKYERNILGEVTEIVDPLGHKTLKEYDAAGNLTKLTDAEKRSTSYKLNSANLITEITYSDGKTHKVEYEYGADGERTKMIDGTGTTTYGYNVLELPTEVKDGHGDTVSYEWNLAEQPSKITYPNGKSVERKYDNAGRLEKVSDWLEHTTSFSWDADSDQTATVFPTTAGEEDKYTLNTADQLTKTEMKKGAEVLASLAYTLDSDGQLKSITQKGLPGEEKPGSTLDEGNRLTKAGTVEYKYDAANNPTKIGATTQTFNAADELEKGVGGSYTYGEVGERTKRTPTSGPATTYGYDQAEDPISVTRPKEGETTAIEDSYAYNGDGLRTSQTIGATTSYLTWDISESLPLLLNDGTTSYIYGPGGLPIEQISGKAGEERALFLHHDQQGSTRMLTSSTGVKEATFTFSAYGELSGHTGTATTPLGFDGQYTNSDTGLIYLRARSYDPSTAQFLTVDPLTPATLAPYAFASDSPQNVVDNSGLCGVGSANEVLNSVNPFSSENCAYQAAKAIYHVTAPVRQVFAEAQFGAGSRLEVGQGLSGLHACPVTGAIVLGGGGNEDILPTPEVSSTKLQNIVNNLYKGTTNPDRIGNGTTADAIRYQGSHIPKGRYESRALGKWLRSNPEAPTSERIVARSLLNDLVDALGGIE